MTLRAQELRIGNWYHDKVKIRNFVVKAIHERYIEHGDEDYSASSIVDSEGIPLTPEWLERFGFKISIHAEDTPNWTSPNAEYIIYLVNGEFKMISESITFKYVHKLMNWHFENFGEELTVKK